MHILIKNIGKIFLELRMQRFYLIFSDAFHVNHLHVPFFSAVEHFKLVKGSKQFLFLKIIFK